jgi:HSP20 family protein
MLMRTEPFADLDHVLARFTGQAGPSRLDRPASMPMDAWKEGDAVFLALDLPGVDPSTIEIDVDRNVLTVRAERQGPPAVEPFISERRHGRYSRQFVLGDQLDLDAVRAGYEAGVLTLRIPVAERAKPRRIAVQTGVTDTARTVDASGDGPRDLVGTN